MQLKYPSGLAIARITCMAPDIGTDQFIMPGLRVIGSGIITTNAGTTATTVTAIGIARPPAEDNLRAIIGALVGLVAFAGALH